MRVFLPLKVVEWKYFCHSTCPPGDQARKLFHLYAQSIYRTTCALQPLVLLLVLRNENDNLLF
eukprot:gene7022-4980_t